MHSHYKKLQFAKELWRLIAITTYVLYFNIYVIVNNYVNNYAVLFMMQACTPYIRAFIINNVNSFTKISFAPIQNNLCVTFTCWHVCTGLLYFLKCHAVGCIPSVCWPQVISGCTGQAYHLQ